MWQAGIALKQKGTKRTGYKLADTNFSNSQQLTPKGLASWSAYS
jgi:hypothetical protein